MASYPKKLRVMAEYDSSGIWVIEPIGPFRHGMISHEKLGLPAELSNKFNAWIDLFWQRPNKEAFDVESFNTTGRALARELKQLVGAKTYVEYQPELADGGIGPPEEVA